MVMPAARREAVAHLEQSYEMGERRACSLIGADRSSVRYVQRRPDDSALREVLRGAAETHRQFGYRRLHVILRREGHVLNRKRTQQLYREEGLSVRRRMSRSA
jgi:putative transposase